MRDIRGDLHERLSEAESRTEALRSEYERERKVLEDKYRVQLVAVDEEKLTIKKLIDIEARRTGVAPQSDADVRQITKPLADFCIMVISAMGPKTKDELRAVAEGAGYFGAGEGGRQIHAVVMNIAKAGRLRDNGNGIYSLPEPKVDLLGKQLEPAMNP